MLELIELCSSQLRAVDFSLWSEFSKAVSCHHCYSTSVQTSWWMVVGMVRRGFFIVLSWRVFCINCLGKKQLIHSDKIKLLAIAIKYLMNLIKIHALLTFPPVILCKRQCSGTWNEQWCWLFSCFWHHPFYITLRNHSYRAGVWTELTSSWLMFSDVVLLFNQRRGKMLLHSAAAHFSFCGTSRMLVLIAAERSVKLPGQGVLLSSHVVMKSLVQLDHRREMKLNIQANCHPQAEADSSSGTLQGCSIFMNKCSDFCRPANRGEYWLQHFLVSRVLVIRN